MVLDHFAGVEPLVVAALELQYCSSSAAGISQRPNISVREELSGPCTAYNSISIKPNIKSHLELQREITLIELAPSPYFFV